MNLSKPWRPGTYVKLAAAVTVIVSLAACAGKRVRPEELSQEKPQSAFNEDNWDTFRSDRNYRTIPANKKTFQSRVKGKKKAQASSVADY